MSSLLTLKSTALNVNIDDFATSGSPTRTATGLPFAGLQTRDGALPENLGWKQLLEQVRTYQETCRPKPAATDETPAVEGEPEAE